MADYANKDHWIIDGNYDGTMDIRFERADTIIFMDIPTLKCFWRVLGRIWKYHGEVRPDMSKGCKERFDLDFLHYVVTYNLLRRKKLLIKLTSLQSKKRICRIKNDYDNFFFLKEIQNINSI